MNVPTAPKAIAKRPRNTVPIAPQASKEAKRLAAVILEVLAGLRTLPQAADALSRRAGIVAALLPVGSARLTRAVGSLRAET